MSLTWPDGLVAAAGSVPELRIRLRNGADNVWLNEPDDTAHVLGWLLDANGDRMRKNSWFAFSGGQPLPPLQPGETVMLPVVMAEFDYANLRAGTYGLDAIVVALDLRSASGSITLR